jgi:hypothetical protein
VETTVFGEYAASIFRVKESVMRTFIIHSSVMDVFKLILYIQIVVFWVVTQCSIAIETNVLDLLASPSSESK